MVRDALHYLQNRQKAFQACWGQTIQELGERYYDHLGYIPQDFGFYPDFTAREFMLYMAAEKD